MGNIPSSVNGNRRQHNHILDKQRIEAMITQGAILTALNGDISNMEPLKERVTAKEIIDLVQSIPDSGEHIYEWEGEQRITQEWLCGNFAGRGFGGKTIEEAAEKMIDYLYRHIGHKSMVGDAVTGSGFPNLNKVRAYCLAFNDREDIA